MLEKENKREEELSMKTFSLFFCFAALCFAGCTMTDVVQVEPSGKIQIPDRPYKRLGKVHGESWGIGFVYSAFLAGSMEKAKDVAEKEASRRGADAIINAECYSETHMPVLMLLGWKENHFSGDAIIYAEQKGGK